MRRAAAADLERISNHLEEHHPNYQHANHPQTVQVLGLHVFEFSASLCFVWKFLPVLDNLVKGSAEFPPFGNFPRPRAEYSRVPITAGLQVEIGTESSSGDRHPSGWGRGLSWGKNRRS